MALDVGSAKGYLDLDITGFLSGLKTAQEEGANASKSFENVGKKISSVGDKMTTVGSKMTKTFTLPMVTAVTAVVKSYADMEQAIGGVETLFKSSSKTVIENSETAFQRAGVSGVQYMEQVVSFSARLLQGLGGDTEEAAKLADMAMVDMSDNANKFGTNIEMVQNAYQGFAKANFTMLDNLKLGYGGTAGEMARLVNESGVLNGAMEATADSVKDIPFDTLIRAINATQKRMGIFGTTSLEATETVSGSFGALKASFMDFMAGLGSGTADVSKLTKNMLDSFQTFSRNVSRVLQNIWDNLPLTQTQKDLIAIVAVAGPILMILGKVISTVGGLVTAIGSVRTAMTLLAANPVMMWILGGAVAIAAIAGIVTAITNATSEAGKLRSELADIDMSVSETAQADIGSGIEKGIALANKTFEISLAVDAEISAVETKVETAFGAVVSGAKKKLSAAELKALKSEIGTFVGGAIDQVKATTEAKAKDVADAMDALGVPEGAKTNAVNAVKGKGDSAIADLQAYESAAKTLLAEMGKAGTAVTEDQLTSFNELLRQIGVIKKEIGAAQEGFDGYYAVLRDKIMRGVATDEEISLVLAFDVQTEELKTDNAQAQYEQDLNTLGVALQAATDENKPEIQMAIDLKTEEFNATLEATKNDTATNVGEIWSAAVQGNEAGKQALDASLASANVFATLEDIFEMPEGFASLPAETKAEVTQMLIDAVPHLTAEQINAPMAPIAVYAGEAIDALNTTMKTGAKTIEENDSVKNALKTILESGALDGVDLTTLPTTLQGALAATDFTSSMGVVGGDLITGLGLGITGGEAGVVTDMQTAAQSVVDGAKKTFGVQSPSTVFDEIGQFNMAGLAQGHATGAEAVAAEFVTAADTMWAGVDAKFAELITATIESIDKLFSELPTKLEVHTALVTTNLDTWGTAISTKAKSIGDDFTLQMDTAIGLLPDKITKTTNSINTNNTTWGTSMSTKAKSIGDDFVLKLNTAVSLLPNKIKVHTDSVITKLTTWATDMGTKGTKAGKALADNTNTEASKLKALMVTVGEDVLVGFWNGIDGKLAWLKTQIKGLVSKIITSIKSEFGIKSPSRRMADEVGVQLPPGIAEGFVAAMPKAMSAVQASLDKGVDGISVPDIETKGSDVGFIGELKAMYEQLAVWFEDIEARMTRSIDNMSASLGGFLQEANVFAGASGTMLGYIPVNGFSRDVSSRGEQRMQEGSARAEGNTFIFHSNERISEVEAARLMIQAQRDVAEGFS